MILTLNLSMSLRSRLFEAESHLEAIDLDEERQDSRSDAEILPDPISRATDRQCRRHLLSDALDILHVTFPEPCAR